MRRGFKLLGFVIILVVMFLLAGLAFLVFGRTDEAVDLRGKVMPTHYENVRPKVDGIIEAVFVDEGDIVHAGDTVAIVRADELRLAVKSSKAALDRANADLSLLREEYQKLLMGEIPGAQTAPVDLSEIERRVETARQEYERARSSREKGLAGPEEVRDKEREYEISRSCYRVFREVIELSQRRYDLRIREKEEEVELASAEYELAAKKLGDSSVVASVTGRVLTPEPRRLIGEKASPGEAVFLIGDLSAIDFVGQVSEADISRVRVGQEAKIFVNAFPHHKYKVFQATVVSISPGPRITDRGTFFEVKARIEDPWVEVDSSSISLPVGLSARAKIVIRHRVRLIELLLGSKG